MRILLQHRRNRFYLRRLGVWTSDAATAYDFERTGRAIDFARVHDLSDVQLLIKFADPGFDQMVPLPPPVREESQLCLFWDCDSENAAFQPNHAPALA